MSEVMSSIQVLHLLNERLKVIHILQIQHATKENTLKRQSKLQMGEEPIQRKEGVLGVQQVLPSAMPNHAK